MFPPVIDLAIQHLISSAVTSAVVAVMASAQTKHKEKMLALREMIEKALLLRESGSSTPLLDPNASSKLSLPADLPSKSTKRWNQADLGYFNSHLDKAHEEGIVVSVGKDVYYRNVVLFVQRLQSLITFKGVAFVKANVATSLRGSVLGWYTYELSDFDRNALNNNLGVKS